MKQKDKLIILHRWMKEMSWCENNERTNAVLDAEIHLAE